MNDWKFDEWQGKRKDQVEFSYKMIYYSIIAFGVFIVLLSI